MVRGDGKVIDYATGEHLWTGTYGDLIIVNETNSAVASARAVWSTEIEEGYMAAELIRLMSSVLAGKMDIDEATGTLTFRDMNDLITRLIVTRDAIGRRTGVTMDVN